MGERNYSELSKLVEFADRYDYLKIGGVVGADTFGFDRIFNQMFYRSVEWKHIRDEVIVRDGGCDLGISGREIHSRILVHHMNPITLRDIELGRDAILDPEYLICVTHRTHNAIHYGDESHLLRLPLERARGDTTLWTPVRT